jgi:ZIP family zinc transporter
MGFLADHSLTLVGVVSAIILVSSFSASFLLNEEEISFTVDEDSIMNDVEQISSFGPRVAGSNEEILVTEYISNRFSEIGLVNIEIEEYQVTGAWFVDAEPDEHQILMHAQLEQGAQNVPGLPDGTAGTARVEIDSTGELNHVEKFTFLGYSGSTHKHDNMLTDLGNGSVSEFSSAGDLTDLAILINYDNQRSLADIYKDSIDRNAAVVMIYTEGVETPPFRSVTVQENGKTVPFPEAYNGQYSDLLIPFIYISESVATLFHDFIEQASEDPTLYASLDGFWEGNNVGIRTVKVVTGELLGTGDKEIMIGAHHDSVYISPGAVDNAVGVSQLIEIASQLSEIDMEATVKFATWGGEELGLLGSQEYLEAHADEVGDLDLYINIDSTNLDPSIGLGTLGIDSSNEKIGNSVNQIKNKILSEGWDGYSASVNYNVDSGNSDHRSFNNIGVNTLGFFGWEYSQYHRQTDTSDIVNQQGLGLTTEIILQVVAKEGGGHNSEQPIIEIQSLEGQSDSWVFPFTIALMAGLATGIGGLIVMFISEITKELMSFMLGMAAGVMLLISIFDLWLGQAMEFGFLIITTVFLLGAGLIVLINSLVKKDEEEVSEKRKLYLSGIFTAIALGIHNFPEGLAIGVAVLESAQYGVVLMIAIGLHNIPEGIAVAAPIKAGGGGKWKAALIALATGMTEPIGALFALLVLGSFLTPLMVGMSLAFVGGIMAIVSFKELIPQAMAQNRNQYMIVGMTFGAAIMQLSLFLLE